MRFEIRGLEPMGAVRMTARGKFVKANAQRYLSYKQLIYNEVLKQIKGVYDPLNCAIKVSVIFYMPIPKSWPKKKKDAAVDEFCTTKPDIDNLIKGLFDSLNGLLWVDDNRIAMLRSYKVYSETPGIDFTISRVGELSHGQAKTKEETKQRNARKAESRAGRDIRARV